MERAFPMATVNLFFGRTSLGQRGVGRDGDEGVQLGVELLNPAETRSGQLHRRDLLRMHKLRCFGESKP
jgi:hypothetical protein